MRARFCTAIAAVSLLGGSTAMADCLPKHRDCVNLDLVPQISQRIATYQDTGQYTGGTPNQYIVGPTRTAADPAAKKPYTGPIVGLSPTVHPTPTVGYRWSLD